jgi:hypothetical protein
MASSQSFYRRADLGSQTQPASEGFRAWLRTIGAPDAIIAALDETLPEDVEEYPLLLLSEAAMMDEKAPGVRIGMANGLLVFGCSLGCGDWAAIDLREPHGAVGYLNHENMQHVADVRKDAFWPVTFSLDEAAELIDSGSFPWDYQDAVRRDLEHR